MNKKDLLIGFIIGIFTALLGSYIFIAFFTNFDVSNGIRTIRQLGYMGKVITVGTVLDLAVFGILLKRNLEDMSKGVVLAVIVLAISTLFI